MLVWNGSENLPSEYGRDCGAPVFAGVSDFADYGNDYGAAHSCGWYAAQRKRMLNKMWATPILTAKRVAYERAAERYAALEHACRLRGKGKGGFKAPKMPKVLMRPPKFDPSSGRAGGRASDTSTFKADAGASASGEVSMSGAPPKGMLIGGVVLAVLAIGAIALSGGRRGGGGASAPATSSFSAPRKSVPGARRVAG